ncbi:MAG TPA: DOMON-like domain-containing protein [Steroidobacteraceae bacterium]|nr:DOMON-like domain-containing protein [Steroidobacteraceae bacterium]
MQKAELQRHPDTHCDAVTRIQVEVWSGQDPHHQYPGGTLRARFAIQGDLSRLSLPQQGVSQRADRLWQHTCCELFVGVAESSAYVEFNFSPSRAWAAYRFSEYREGMANFDIAPPQIDVTIEDEYVMQVAAMLPRDHVFDRLAAACVVEQRDGAISYWAVRHPPGKPDFHHAAGFALPLSIGVRS